ncbi:hypothetical protein C8R43DRAFT_1177962 [Mycena crocata]|nr:hypothetical protein C8R43DRAFT_1177962 [Mycena crocata]
MPGRGRPKGSKNTSGHNAGGKRVGTGPKKRKATPVANELTVSAKVLGKRKARDEDDNVEASSSRRGVSPSSRSRSSTATPTIASGRTTAKLPMRNHPIFGKNARLVSENSSGSTTPNIPSLPHIPIIIPEDELASPTPVPPDVLQPAEASACLNDMPSHVMEDTEEQPVEDEPDPKGVVQEYILRQMMDIRDRQLPKHGMPDCYRVGKTFWIRPPNRWFALQEYKSTAAELVPDPCYYDDIFLWLPKCLLPKDFEFLCIFCGKAKMSDAGWNSNPTARRVVNLDSCYYILSKRVKCDSCRKSCSLYEDKILAQLPKHLANEFPAFLTHRSGIDKNLVTLIRSSIAQGLTPHAWERILRELHVRKRDLGEQSYVHALNHCAPAQLPDDLIPFSSFNDQKGFAGFSPSRWYINAIYIDYMSYVKPHQDQAMAALEATLVGWDQSFKAIKYIARLNGSRVFGSLWTLINQYVQIRQMILTPTQHMHHVEQPLKDIIRSLHEHGHAPISLLWTDNVKADHQFAERVIPTLRVGNDSTSADKTSYPDLQIPHLVVHLASSLQLIDNACSTIMSTVGDETTNKMITVGFSIEWDWRASQAGHFPAAMMQIAMNNVVYLLQTYHVSAPTKVPASLKALLFSNRVIKIGYHVQGNLDILMLLWELKKTAHGKDSPGGWVDIGVLAKSKGLVPSPSVSFQKISEGVLRKNMNNLQAARLSDWCRQDLSEDQRRYAIRNAWASHEIYKAIVDRPPAGARLSRIGRLGDPVTLRNGDMNIAHGFFPEPQTHFQVSNSKTITLTRSKRAVITVTDILAPSFICHYHEITLGEMGAPPFDIVVDLASLVSRERHTITTTSARPHPPANSTQEDVFDVELSRVNSEAEEEEDSSLPNRWDESDSDSDRDCDSDVELEFASEPSADIGDISDPEPVHQPELDPDDSEYEQYMDAEVDALIAVYPDPLATSANHPLVQPSDASLPHSTNTFQDIWHEMRRVTKTIDSRHSLAKQFARWLRDAILVPDKIDKAQVEAVLKKGGITWNQAVRSKPDWVWARVRRYIPPAEYLEPVLQKLFDTHADAVCSQHGIKLFNEETHKAAEAMLDDLRQGWLSDPPGVALFNRLRTDKNGLSVWHCERGTNSLEGGVHMPVRDRFGSLGASVELTMALLSDFCYRKNVESGSRHKEGVEYDGHFDPWLEDDIDIVFQSLPFASPRQTHPGYVNASLFKPTHESFIITPLAQTVRDSYNIPRRGQPSLLEGRISEIPSVGLSGARTNRYDFLASAQDTKFAVTPIHTNEEYSLFNKALRPSGAFSSATGTPNFKQMAKWWSERVDGKKIFFKLPEHFTNHFKTWKALRAELTTMQLTEPDRADFMDIVRSDAHTSVVLDESYSPVVQGRKAAASSAKIAVRNRQNTVLIANKRDLPEASTSNTISRPLPPPPPTSTQFQLYLPPPLATTTTQFSSMPSSSMSTGKPVPAEGTFPAELERDIFEMAALKNPKELPTLLRVARRVLTYMLEPIL